MVPELTPEDTFDLSESQLLESIEERLEYDDVATEGFKDTVSKLVKFIKELLLKIKDALKNNFNSTMVAVRAQMEWIDIYRDKARARLNLGAGDSTFTLRNNVSGLTFNYRPVTSITTLISHLRTLERIGDFYFKWANAELVKTAGKFTSLVKGLDVTNIDADKEALVKALAEGSPLVFAKRANLREFSGSQDTLATDALLGNRRLFVKGPSNPTGLQEFGRLSVSIGHTERNPRPVPSEVTIGRFGIALSNQLLSQIENNCKVIMSYFGNQEQSRRKKLVDDLLTAVESIAPKLDKEEPDASTKSDIRNIVSSTRALVGWLNNPYEGMASLMVMVNASCLAVVNRNITVK